MTTADQTPVADARDIECTLLELLNDGKGGAAARVQAAKLLLDRIAPTQDDEQRRREAEERATAIGEARCLMAEFAIAKSAGLHEPAALDQGRAAGSADAGG